ncbi:unnamed protein product [Camellia sinensis]
MGSRGLRKLWGEFSLYLIFHTNTILHLQMAQKLVLKVMTMTDEKTKKKAIEATADSTGVDSIAADLKEQKITMIGEMDTVAVVKKMKKVGKVDIISVRVLVDRFCTVYDSVLTRSYLCGLGKSQTATVRSAVCDDRVCRCASGCGRFAV